MFLVEIIEKILYNYIRKYVIYMKCLEYPFDSNYILKNKKQIKRELLENGNFIEKKIAILGGSTTSEIKNILELFLLNYGIKAIFYESEYNKFYEDAIFGNNELDNFNPDIIYIHTTNRNIFNYPKIQDSIEEVNNKLNEEYKKYESIWLKLESKFNAVIIQNNFELPFYRLMGNKCASDIHGRINFITRLNQMFYNYANLNKNFFINDINYISACYGLDKWANQFYYHMYKYAMELPAIPYLSFNIANIIKSIYGKNKKAIVLDLDNTIWGGIIGDDGVENLKIGSEFPIGRTFLEFQEYIKMQRELGIVLNVNSKNEYDIAISGLNNSDNLLKPDDFVSIKANWQPKNMNIKEIAEELNINEDSLIFIDDNPVERKIVQDYNKNISVPEIDVPENYIRIIDHNSFFEITTLTEEDIKKSELYKENAIRHQYMNKFEDYDEYLQSLKMKAEVAVFNSLYLDRIQQLINKTNQFNLTTRRYSLSDINEVCKDENNITLYGKLEDIFGDNGLVTVVIGKVKNNIELHIDLWLMSCRVLKRNMEHVMLDALVEIARKRNIKYIYGYYFPSKKNKMVSDFYLDQGFEEISCDELGNKIYKLDIVRYEKKNNVIEVTWVE